MKTQIKAIVASAVVIALCLAAVGGVTYSWFSDSEETDVTIQTGKIDLNLEITGMTVKSYGHNTIPIPATGTPITTSLGGKITATVDRTDTFAEKVVINFKNAAPGDLVSFSIDGTLSNSINVIYNQAMTIEEQSGYPTHPFEITGIATGHTDYAASETPTSISNDITIKMKESAGNEYQNKNYQITLMFEAYQSNYSEALTETQVIPAGSAQTITTFNSGIDSQVKISFPEGAFNQEVTLSATATSAVDSTDASYSIINGGEILGGVDVTITDSNGPVHNLDQPATITMTIPLTDHNIIAVCHNGADIAIVDTPQTGTYATIDDVDGKTVITIHNVTAFSSYYAYNKAEAKIGGIHYATLEEAISAATTGSTIKMLRDATVDSQIVIDGKTLTIDCGKRTISSEINNTLFIVKNGADITFNNGIIDTVYAPIHIIFGSTATFNNTEFEIGDSIYVSSTHYMDGKNKVYYNSSTYPYHDYLILNNVDIDSTYGAVAGFINANITINGGTITDHIGGGLITNGTKGLNGQNWNISGVTFNIGIEEEYDSDAANYIAVGIQCHNGGTWNITDCAFNMKNGIALSVRGGEVNVSNCTYNYISVDGYNTTGKLQFTDTVVDVSVPHAIYGIYYANGGYGYTEDSKLTINGVQQTIAIPPANGQTDFYFDFDTTA